MESTVREAVLDAGRALGLPGPVTEAFARLLRPVQIAECRYGQLAFDVEC
ncbi:hypothetical protein [Streptomyces sp. NPDC058374]